MSLSYQLEILWYQVGQILPHSVGTSNRPGRENAIPGMGRPFVNTYES